MPRTNKVAIVIKDGMVDAIVSNDDVLCLILDYDDINDEELPDIVERVVNSADAPLALTQGDPDEAVAEFKKAGQKKLSELKALYGE